MNPDHQSEHQARDLLSRIPPLNHHLAIAEGYQRAAEHLLAVSRGETKKRVKIQLIDGKPLPSLAS